MMQPKRKHETTEYKLSKAIIQNHFYSTYAVRVCVCVCGGGGGGGGACIYGTYVVLPVAEGVKN